jgi:hypothetical protein
MNNDGQGDPPDHDDEKVGYGKPPKHSRFTKGKSGNDKGRPPGAKNKPAKTDEMAAMFAQECARPVKLKQGDKTEEMPTLRAIIRRTANQAMQGNTSAQKLMMNAATMLEDKRRSYNATVFAVAVEYKLDCERRIAEAKREGKPPPHFVVHPDSLVLDFDHHEVTSTDLMTDDERDYVDGIQQMLAFAQTALKDLSKAEFNADEYETVREDLANAVKILENSMRALELPWSDSQRKFPDIERMTSLKKKIMNGK